MIPDDHGTYPSQRGFAWRGDWKQRLSALLADHGHDSVTSFLAAYPRRSLLDLADSVLGGGDVAAVQLLWTVLDEAKVRGPAAAESCARDLLIRSMHQHMKRGWDPADLEAEGQAYSGWACELERIAKVNALALWEALVESAPPGWLPNDADDPILVAAFREHWPRAPHPPTEPGA